jgi:hypothetical protein
MRVDKSQEIKMALISNETRNDEEIKQNWEIEKNIN